MKWLVTLKRRIIVSDKNNQLLDGLLNKNVLVRSATMYNVGCFIEYDDGFLKLKEASWVADVGHWNKALKTGVFTEVEPHEGSVYVSRGGIIDCVEWKHELPKEVK